MDLPIQNGNNDVTVPSLCTTFTRGSFGCNDFDGIYYDFMGFDGSQIFSYQGPHLGHLCLPTQHPPDPNRTASMLKHRKKARVLWTIQDGYPTGSKGLGISHHPWQEPPIICRRTTNLIPSSLETCKTKIVGHHGVLPDMMVDFCRFFN